MKDLSPLQIRKRINKVRKNFNTSTLGSYRIENMENVLIKKQIQYHKEMEAVGCKVIIDDKF